MIKRDSSSNSLFLLPGIGKPLAFAVLCLGISAPILAEQHSSRRTQTEAAPAEEENETSVLVATREAPAGTTVTHEAKVEEADGQGEALEPISQSSDYSPELAATGDREDSSNNFGEALEKVAKTAKPADAEVMKAAKVGEAKEPKFLPDQSGTPSSGSARRAAAARQHGAHFEPVKFQGVCAGKTSKHELITAWGEPTENTTTGQGEVLVFQKSPFKSIEALIGDNEIVSSIKVTLANPLETTQLSSQLGLDKFEPVTVTDETDAPVCLAFPEKGVLFMFGSDEENVTPVDEQSNARADTSHIAHVVLQPIDACAFAFRAENRLHGPYAQNISDLKSAIALDPELARAYWLLARIYIATGQADLADAATAEACDIEPKNASFQLCRAASRELLGEYDDAVLGVRAVLDREDLSPIDRAQALHLMGHLASFGDKEIGAKTVPFETKAIEIADKLASSKDGRERRAAKQLLIEAHLAIAEEVARQTYNDKSEALSQWIGRASGLAEDFITKDNGSIELRLLIAQHALGALANIKPTLDPAPWISEAEDAAKALLTQSDDELWQQRVKWELGIAYLHALRVDHTRRQTEPALKYGQLAIDNMAVGASARQAVHGSEQLVGQLYFQMGAVYAVHKLDHTKAAQWYEKAAPLLTGKRPVSELYAPRREGEMLVSMGVSYWQLGNQTKALDLTQSGVALIEAAVKSGVLSKSTLGVPYNNLATMYQQMGEKTNAAKYAELAKGIPAATSASTTDAKPQQLQQPRVGRRSMQNTRTR
jgi:tetratricopeptide (TPR) repeat protein